MAWERTLGDLLSETGYACGAYGKWHVGEGAGRWPTDKGFDEWYGPPRTYDEALWPDDPWYVPERDGVSRMLHARRGDTEVAEGDQLTHRLRHPHRPHRRARHRRPDDRDLRRRQRS